MKKLNIFMAGVLSLTSFLLLAPTQVASAIVFSSKVATKTKVTTITCYKATTSKKVTSISPKCPTGWTTKKPVIAPKPKPITSSSSFISKNIPPATINTCADISVNVNIYLQTTPYSTSNYCFPRFAKSIWYNSIKTPVPMDKSKVAITILCLPIVPKNISLDINTLIIYTEGVLAIDNKCHERTDGKRKTKVQSFLTTYWRFLSIPSVPVINSITPIDSYSVKITLVKDQTNSISSPIAYYSVKESPDNIILKYVPSDSQSNQIIVDGLTPQKNYQFILSASNIDGTSIYSNISSTVSMPMATSLPAGVPSIIDNKGYSIDQNGPGGGVVFYYSNTAFTELGSTCASQCHYLEFAPADWIANALDGFVWSPNNYETTAGNMEIGGGLSNTKNMTLFDQTPNSVAFSALAYTGNDNSLGQWFIPSDLELSLFSQSKIFNAMVNHGPGGKMDLWSSTDSCRVTSVKDTQTIVKGCSPWAFSISFSSSGVGSLNLLDKRYPLYVYVVRAF